MSIREGLVGYYELCGLKGVAAICSHRILGLPKELTLHPTCAKSPVHLRVRTSDMSVYKSVLLGAEYDLPLPFNPTTIVDGGANCGMATLFFANKYPHAKIVAVEPEAGNFATLTKNVQRYPNVLPIQAALWNRDCTITLGTDSHYEKYAFRVSGTGLGTAVKGMTIRTVMQNAQIDSIDLLKLDIEGSEGELFESPDWLPAVRAIAVEFHEKLRPGCKAMADVICRNFKSWQRGETTFYVRQ